MTVPLGYTHLALRAAAEWAGVEVETILRPLCRKQHYAKARWAVMRGLRLHGATLQGIGQRLNRDHKTVHHGLQAAETWMKYDPAFAALCAKLEPTNTETEQ